MAHVHEEQEFDVPVDEIWGRIGDFHGMAGWHPAVERSESTAGGKSRDLHVVDGGGVISETQLEDAHERSVAYRIDESPLPVADYTARLWAEEQGSGSIVRWEADFEPKDASEEEAVGVIRGIFRGGLDAL